MPESQQESIVAEPHKSKKGKKKDADKSLEQRETEAQAKEEAEKSKQASGRVGKYVEAVKVRHPGLSPKLVEALGKSKTKGEAKRTLKAHLQGKAQV